MAESEVVIPKVWRSELWRLLIFIGLSPVAYFLSKTFPISVLRGPLFSVGDERIILDLPLFWFLPVFFLGQAIYRIYNVRYSIDSRGIEARDGILSLKQSITRIRFEDIRSIETEQKLVERILDIGLVEMGTAATAGLELVFEGVGSPKKIQALIQAERDERIRRLRGNNSAESQHNGAHSVVGNE